MSTTPSTSTGSETACGPLRLRTGRGCWWSSSPVTRIAHLCVPTAVIDVILKTNLSFPVSI